ncbi:LysR family transcriptional regulator [Maledivibacter halophilus]|uniref:DNA-binding transcriptional regulator, LysR family n=1 Tax=Maledivibacter halophilus TaxID=36842 RepID=A0A1T5M9N6_9FIRM|nr:LysR family transcriptional regulator [Maledivibacter halophilus]SKC84579.1 DNA-binding transcriptional regulator, LysR family [Maledivibacter halophilus]
MDNSLLYIYTVYKTKSFSKAANQLYITQPALSIAIKKVEQAAGSPLFDRKKNPIQLTDAGRIYIDKIEKIMFIEEDLKRQIQDLENLQSGHISIAGTHYVNSYILPPVLKEYMSKYPRIEIEILENDPEKNLELLKEGKANISFNAGEYNKDDFNTAVAFNDFIFLAVPENFVLNFDYEKYEVKYEEIAEMNYPYDELIETPLTFFDDLPVILLTPHNSHYHTTQKIYKEIGIEPNIILLVDQSATAYHLAASGIAAVFVSDLIITNNKPNRMRYFKLQTQVTKRTFLGLTNKSRYTTKATKEFIRIMQSTYDSLSL